ncbi:MAG: bacterioferritin [Planctomycetes bacterium]|nr:bacterioferritin [Planctomycetota bacterium]
MQAKPGILDALQEVLTKELTGINQYFLHSRMCGNQGYQRMAKKQYDESMEEMRHAVKLMDRMLMLEGKPNMTRYEKIHSGGTPMDMLSHDLDLEKRAVATLQDAIKVTFDAHDHVTREIFEHILADEEEHIDWLEAELAKIEAMGAENWLATQQYGHDD